jgi:hypothetical protein
MNPLGRDAFGLQVSFDFLLGEVAHQGDDLRIGLGELGASTFREANGADVCSAIHIEDFDVVWLHCIAPMEKAHQSLMGLGVSVAFQETFARATATQSDVLLLLDVTSIKETAALELGIGHLQMIGECQCSLIPSFTFQLLGNHLCDEAEVSPLH